MELSPDTPGAVYSVDGDHFVPSILAQGPWDPTTCHGGPVTGLLARAIERAGADEPKRVARLTVDLLRPVPLEPVEVLCEIVRAGRQISVIDATMWWQDKLVSRASAVLVRCDRAVDVDDERNRAAAGSAPADRAPDGVSEFAAFEANGFVPPGFVRAVELYRVAGGMRQGVPAIAWTRMVKPLVEGESITPLQRVACLGDFTSGLANHLDFLAHATPNADLSYHLVRLPVGEWIGIDAATVASPDGIAQSRAQLFDDTGFIGSAGATIVVSPRDTPPT